MFQYHDLLSKRFTAKVYVIYEQTTHALSVGVLAVVYHFHIKQYI